MGDYDKIDHYGTLTVEEAEELGVVRSSEQLPVVMGDESSATEVSQTIERKS